MRAALSDGVLQSGPRTFLRRPRLDDLVAFVALARKSRQLHRSFARPPDSASAFRSWLARSDQPNIQIHLLCRHEDAAIAGVLNLTEIVRGPLQSANLGYYVFEPYAGQGYMREGVGLVLARAFSGLGLHRVEANVQPGNTASLRLVLACGFRCEGYSPRLVYIDSRWRDHVRFAIDRRDWRARPGAAARPAPAVKPKKRRGPSKGPR